MDTEVGLRVVKITFFVLLGTSVVEAAIAFLSGSAGLLADTVHSVSNTATTLPLWVAFVLSRRRATRNYPYGYHRSEDVAGIIILLLIFASAVLVGYRSVGKLLSGDKPSFIPLAMVVGGVGFVANEAVAQYRIRVGRRIESAALLADGQHARVDGLGSLAVVVGLAMAAAGFPEGDAIVGLVITALIAYLLVREAAPTVLSRVMDRMDPGILSQVEGLGKGVPQVKMVTDVRARWVGHSLLAELSVGVDGGLTVEEGHAVAERVEHELLHHVGKLQRCVVHVEPTGGGTGTGHQITGYHFDDGAEGDEEGRG